MQLNTDLIPKKTFLKGDPIAKEDTAGATVIPGQLIDYNASEELVPHAADGGVASRSFAAEQDYIGQGIDHPYSAGDRVKFNACRMGDEIYAFLAAGQTVKKGAYLQSAGNGSLKTIGAGKFAVAKAIEAVDNSAGANPVRIKVEVV